MAGYNLILFNQVDKIRTYISQLTGKTPEQLQAFSDLAAKANELKLSMSDVNIKNALDAAIAGLTDNATKTNTNFVDLIQKDLTNIFNEITGKTLPTVPGYIIIGGTIIPLNPSTTLPVAPTNPELTGNTTALGALTTAVTGLTDAIKGKTVEPPPKKEDNPPPKKEDNPPPKKDEIGRAHV